MATVMNFRPKNIFLPQINSQMDKLSENGLPDNFEVKEDHLNQAKIIWDYLLMGHNLEKVILLVTFAFN